MPCDKVTQREYIERDYQMALRNNPIKKADIWYIVKIDPITNKVIYEFPNDSSFN